MSCTRTITLACIFFKNYSPCNITKCNFVFFHSFKGETSVFSILVEINFLFSQPKHDVVGTQKNRLNEMVLLSTQNTSLNLRVRK